MMLYQPVSCEIHSRYELMIMQHSRITLGFLDASDKQQQVTGTPVDLYARKGEEFIVLQTDTDKTLTIRLDRIVTCETC
jgi:transcriptional antiterminator Rof (Rho-off)